MNEDYEEQYGKGKWAWEIQQDQAAEIKKLNIELSLCREKCKALVEGLAEIKQALRGEHV